MRWVFFCLLILNVVYLVFSLVSDAAPQQQRVQPEMVVAAGAAELVLLEEAGAQPAQESAATPAMPPLCPVLGPWANKADADRAAKSLRDSGYSLRVDAVEVERDRLHWVFLPPQATREDALRLLRELQGKGVDSFIVADGDDANAISLGYFSSADSARGLMVKMKTAGYPAEVRATARRGQEFWLQVDGASIRDDGAALRALIAATAGVRGEHVACQRQIPSAATSENVSPDP